MSGLNVAATVKAAINATPQALPELAHRFGVTQTIVMLWADGLAQPPDRDEVVRTAETLMRWHKTWNPRFLAYCQAGGNPDPDKMLAHDEKRWKGGKMTGFVLWVQERWSTWRKLQGIAPDAPLFDADHQEFDRWLWQNLGSVE